MHEAIEHNEDLWMALTYGTFSFFSGMDFSDGIDYYTHDKMLRSMQICASTRPRNFGQINRITY